MTRPLAGDVYARTALFRISCEPAPSTMLTGLTPNLDAIALASAPSPGVLLKG